MTVKTLLIARISENLPPQMTGDVMQGWIDNPVGLAKFLGGLCPSTEGKYRHLKLVDSVTLAATSGERTIVNAEVFSCLDHKFKTCGLNKKGKATKETEVDILKMDGKNGTFQDIFGKEDGTIGWMGRKLDDLVLTQDQFIVFCDNNRNHLRKGGYGTFCLIKEDEEYFVAYAYFGSYGSLSVNVGRLAGSNVWYAGCRRRFVVPANRHQIT